MFHIYIFEIVEAIDSNLYEVVKRSTTSTMELELLLHRDYRQSLTMPVKLETGGVSGHYSVLQNRDSKCSYSVRTSLRSVVLCSIVIVILSLCSVTTAMPSALLCQAECLHGGKMHVPDGPFAYCMCICPRRFVGLRCEFNRMFGRRIRRINRLKRLVKIRNEVEGMLTDKRRHRHYKRWPKSRTRL